MVKKVKRQIRKEEIYQRDKIQKKMENLITIRKKQFLRDQKRAALKLNKQIPKIKSTNPHQFPVHVSPLIFKATSSKDTSLQIQKQVHAYKVALSNVDHVLQKLKQMKIKNQRPSDYLVEMYKSDKQMMKVRRYLTDKENDLKEKMQGKDWQSKNKRKQRAKKKAEIKRERKKLKTQAKRPKLKMDKVNGKNKIKK